MPQYKRKPTKYDNDIFRSMFGVDIPGYVPEMTRADSLGLIETELDIEKKRTGLQPTREDTLGLEKLELGVEEQRRGLQTTSTDTRKGLLDSLSTEQLRGETLKPHEITGLEGAGGYLPTKRAKTLKEIGIDELEAVGRITPTEASSMRAGLDVGEKEKFTATPWFLNDEWIDTPTGKSALEKYLKGDSIKEQLAFWAGIQKDTSSSLTGKPINKPLFDRAKREIDSLLKREIPAEYEVEGEPKVGPLIQTEKPTVPLKKKSWEK